MLGSSLALRDKSVSVVACVLIVALGPIQFGFNLSGTNGVIYYSSTIFKDAGVMEKMVCILLNRALSQWIDVNGLLF
ncbi:hypothetical protein V6N13_001342 [Hibiscus sabdariffa]